MAEILGFAIPEACDKDYEITDSPIVGKWTNYANAMGCFEGFPRFPRKKKCHGSGGFTYVIWFIFTPKIGEDFQFDEYFSNGGFNHQLVKLVPRVGNSS